MAFGWIMIAVIVLGDAMPTQQPQATSDRPNILWLTCEDISPNLGCYGDSYAITPNLDAMAKRSIRYTHAFAPIGVCAPSRSTLITGMWANSIGTHHMRCQGRLPSIVTGFPKYLRDAGYYTSNNVKTDYNFKHKADVWDDSSNKAHWRNRKPGQPFFSVFNYTVCHESQIRQPENSYQKRIASFEPNQIHDPAKAPIPPYHPDTPEVRKDWARYADMITAMDQEVGKQLEQLQADGLEDNTIVFFFSDHGAGMPRSKRWLYDSSLHVPMMVHFPLKYAHLAPSRAGTTCDRMVSFVDFAPTVLSLAGVEIPKHLQGSAFLGEAAGTPREYVYGFRDRMDERTDFLRAVRSRKYVYIRNYYWDRPWFHEQRLWYAIEMPTLRVWQNLASAGKLTGHQATFMAKSKPIEELYDIENDPWELKNLAGDPARQDELTRFREVLTRWQLSIGDLGFMPEVDLRSRFQPFPEYDAIRAHPETYPLKQIIEHVNQNDIAPSDDRLATGAKHEDPTIRYWSAVAFGRSSSTERSASELTKLLGDESAAVQLAACEALLRLEQKGAANSPQTKLALTENLQEHLQAKDANERTVAIDIIDRFGKQFERNFLQQAIDALQEEQSEYPKRIADYLRDRIKPIDD